MKGNRIILIGEEDSKRTEFFLKAAETQQIPVGFYAWSEWKNKDIFQLTFKVAILVLIENIIHSPKKVEIFI